MTEEERQRLQAEYLRKAQEQVSMLSQSAMTPEALAEAMQQSGYDPSGRETMLASMLRGGQDAMATAMPQGKAIGDIYVAPTWSESLNAAVAKGIGGYQMGQARQEQKAIDEQRALSKTAAAQVAGEAARLKQLQGAESNVAKILDTQSDEARADKALAQRATLAENRIAADERRLAKTLAAKGDPSVTAAERERHNRELERLAALRLAQKGKSAGFELGTAKEREQFAQGGAKLRATQGLVENYKPEYSPSVAARATGLGELETKIQGVTGIGTEGQSGFWSDAQKANLIPRHEMFGSAFTPNEQKAYDATTITQDLRPEEVQSRLKKRLDLETLATQRMAAGALLKGMDPKTVKLYYGDVLDIDALQASLADGSYDAAQTARREGTDAAGAPEGVPPDVWAHMTPEEKSLWK